MNVNGTLYLLNIFIFYGYTIIFFFAHMGCLFQFMIN